MLSEQLNRDLEESMQLRIRAIRGKISLAFTFCAVIETKLRYGRRDEAARLRDKLCATMDHLHLRINPYTHLPEMFLAECNEQLARLDQRVSLINLAMRG